MPGEGILSIGATVDKTGVEAGLGSIQDGVQSMVQTIAVQVEETCARTTAALKRIPESVKVASESVSQVQRKAAEDSIAYNKSQLVTSGIMRAIKTGAIDATKGVGLLAAAQQEGAQAAARMGISVAAAKAETAKAAEEASLSSNVWVASFQRAARGVGASCTSIQEKLVQTAETGKLSAEGITAGFAGLGSLLGAGIFVGFAAHFLDETSKMVIELDHLSQKTKMSVETLAGLQQIVRESGGEWDAISTGLVRMEKNLAASIEPSKQLREALAGIGLTVQELKGLKPEEQLERIAIAFSKNTNAGNQAAAAIALFGKGGAALIPILNEQGAALHDNIAAASKLTGVTKESVDAAFAWQQTTARLSAEFRSVMIPTIEIVEKAIAGLWGTVMAVDSVIASLDYGIRGLFRSAVTGIGLFYCVLADAMTGNWSAIKADAAAAAHQVGQIWSEEGNKIAKGWQNVGSLMTWQPLKRKEAPESDVDTDPATGKDGNNGDGSKGGKGGAARGKASSAPAYGPPVLAPAPQTQSPDMSSANAELIAQLQAEVKAKQDAIKSEMEADRAAAEEKMRMAAEDYADVERNTAFEVRMGHMSAEQRIAALLVASNQENQIRQQQSKFIEMLDAKDQKAYERDLKQEEQATRQHMRQIAQLNQQTALDTAKNWQHAFDRMSETFAHNTASWITGQQSLAQAWRKTLVGMTATVVENLLKQAIAYITHAATVEAVQERQKMKDAAEAARKAYVAVSAIPVVGPFLAPIAAAGAFAAVEAFEQGGIVGGRGAVPILAHAGERVLTQSQTTNFEKMVNSSSSSSSQANHFHYAPQISGIDGASVAGMARKHGSTFTREAMRQLRLSNQI